MTRQIAVALMALAVLIGATIAAETVVAAPEEPAAEFTEEVAVTSGTWYCMPIVRDGETATVSIGAVGEEASQVSIERFADGSSSFEDPVDLQPDQIHEIEVGSGEAPPALVVRWRGGPVVGSWRVDGDEQRLGDACAQSPAPRWTMTGAETTVGSTTRLHLFNPFGGDAVVRVAFATPEGRINLVSSDNVSVPAGQIVDLSINELQPEQPDLGIIVEVQAGRVIANALQRFGQPDLPEVELEGAEPPTDPNAPEGRTVLPATAVGSEAVGLAYNATGEATTSWVTVANTDTRPANVAVDVTDAIEGSTIDQEIVVGPESVERIDLSGVSSAPNFGVTLTSTNGVPIAANGFVALTGDDKRVSAMRGVPEADAMNAQAVAPPGSTSEIALYNPGPGDATATVSVAGAVPDNWSSIALPAGSMQLLPFADADVSDGGPVEASADQPIYASLRLSTGDDRVDQFLALPLVPANVWRGSAVAPPPVQDRTLDTRPVDFPIQSNG